MCLVQHWSQTAALTCRSPGSLQRFVSIHSAIRNCFSVSARRRSVLTVRHHRLEAIDSWNAATSDIWKAIPDIFHRPLVKVTTPIKGIRAGDKVLHYQPTDDLCNNAGQTRKSCRFYLPSCVLGQDVALTTIVPCGVSAIWTQMASPGSTISSPPRLRTLACR